jgi:hypothetical protein
LPSILRQSEQPRPPARRIVFLSVDGPVKNGFVAGVNRPGGNMTGVTTLSTELPTKRLDVRRKIVPNAMTVAYLTSPVPGPPTAEEQTSKVLAAAGALGQQVIVVEVRNVPTVGESLPGYEATAREPPESARRPYWRVGGLFGPHGGRCPSWKSTSSRPWAGKPVCYPHCYPHPHVD